MELECQVHQFCSWFFSGQLLVELLTASSLFTACLRCTIFFLRVLCSQQSNLCIVLGSTIIGDASVEVRVN